MISVRESLLFRGKTHSGNIGYVDARLEGDKVRLEIDIPLRRLAVVLVSKNFIARIQQLIKEAK